MEDLKKDIKKVLKEYGCLHKGGKLWDEVIRKQRNKDLVNDLFALYGVVASVLCIDSKHSDSITQGVKYKLIAETEDYYGIINDMGNVSGYCKWRFKSEKE